MAGTPGLVEEIRASSRSMARDWGFMGGTFVGVDLPPSAVHALLEIEGGDLSAKELALRLRLDKSSVSRLLRKLVESGDVIEIADARDSRFKRLSLSDTGKRRVAGIHAHARTQVEEALQRLEPQQHGVVREGLRLYSSALASGEERRGEEPGMQVETGYQTGLIARITQMHALYYGKECGFGQRFEAVVAAGLAEFSHRLDRPHNRVWTAVHRGNIAGSVAIDGEDLGPGVAHLRWFIVDDSVRGSGAGRKLLSSAVEFADQRGFEAIHLWTFRGLHAARHLYESYGFECAEERPGSQWGQEVMEQRFVRMRPALDSHIDADLTSGA